MADVIDMPEAWNDVFNVGADKPYTVKELAERVARAMGVEPRLRFLPARNEVMHAYSAHDKVERVFGKRHLHSLEDGLAAMAAWVRQHGARQSQKFKEIEIEKNLPAVWLE